MPRPSRATRRRTPAHSEARDNRQNATSLTKDAYMYDVYRRNSGKPKQLDPSRQWAAAASTALGSAQTALREVTWAKQTLKDEVLEALVPRSTPA